MSDWVVGYIWLLGECLNGLCLGTGFSNQTYRRPAGPSATETGRETQERTVREVWRRVRTLDYLRPGA
jgi:hypothetical protein